MTQSQKKRADHVAKKLWDSFVAPDYGSRVALAGAIVPHGSLKSALLRKKLSWVETLANKFVTLAVARRSVKVLERKYHLSVPLFPGVSREQWREQQSQKIVKLCYRVKKNL